MRSDAGALALDLEAVSSDVDPRGAAFVAALRPALWALEAAMQSAALSPRTAAGHALLARAAITEALNVYAADVK